MSTAGPQITLFLFPHFFVLTLMRHYRNSARVYINQLMVKMLSVYLISLKVAELINNIEDLTVLASTVDLIPRRHLPQRNPLPNLKFLKSIVQIGHYSHINVLFYHMLMSKHTILTAYLGVNQSRANHLSQNKILTIILGESSILSPLN